MAITNDNNNNNYSNIVIIIIIINSLCYSKTVLMHNLRCFRCVLIYPPFFTVNLKIKSLLIMFIYT